MLKDLQIHATGVVVTLPSQIPSIVQLNSFLPFTDSREYPLLQMYLPTDPGTRFKLL